jgi:GalNAc-alpha-(1->4)-GalNAc-alpha-(1->3)-diNAcBac-PP-undecaprenol alpha-1,4-N-acetyl-D-galactosaminyltransferase
MRLTLVIASLGGGGAERTASVLASAWAEQGNHVTILTLTHDDVPAYTLHPAIHLRHLRALRGAAKNLLHGIIRQLSCVRILRKALRQSRPDLIIGFMSVPNVVTLLASRGLSTPVVIVEQTHAEYYRMGWTWETLRSLVYRRAGILVCTNKPMMEWFRQNTRVNACVIPNPVALPPQATRNFSEQSSDRQIIIGMGRLVPEKGFDLLLQAFSRIASRHAGWYLKIVGEGELREVLQAQAEKLNVANRVEFMGWLQDPFSLLRTADLFVFSSRFEGFGNALCEAMACGLPVISFDCPAGPAEIIRTGIDGVLVPPEDVDALAAAMDRLMSDAQERARLAARAPEIVLRFGLTPVLALWEQVFASLLPETSKLKRPT